MDRVGVDRKYRGGSAVLRWTGWILPALTGFVVQRLMAGSPRVAERVLSRGLFRVVSTPIARLTSWIPFSVTELLTVAALPVAVVLCIRLIRHLRRADPGRRGAVAGRALRRLLWTLSILFLFFMVLHGWNYTRLPLSESMQWEVRERSADDLARAAVWLADRASEARTQVRENADGVMVLTGDIRATLAESGTVFDDAAKQMPLLAGPPVRPKGVLLSRYWSYTGITGMYFPFLVEANVNVDAPHSSLPNTMLHEIAHTRGFAREDEAGFLAYLAGTGSTSPDFRYSAFLHAYLSLSNQLYAYDEESWAASWDHISEAIHRDLAYQSDYWKQFEGPVREVSEQVNNTYLQANLQTDGVRSYGRNADLILAHLYQTVPELKDPAQGGAG